MLANKNAGPVVVSLLIAGVLVFCIHEHMVVQQKQEVPVVTQSVQEAPAMTANQRRDPFPKETGNPSEALAEGQVIDIPYTPPASDQNQQQGQQGQDQPQQSQPQSGQAQKPVNSDGARTLVDDGSVQYQDGPAVDNGQPAGN